MNKEDKILAFEYLVTELLRWKGNGIVSNDNDFSILKSLKLLFFVSAVGTNSESSDTLLDKAFGNFCAMTYGHVESDIYEEYKNKEGKFNNIIIDKHSTTVKDQYFSYNLTPQIKSKIDESITLLRDINKEIVHYKTFKLVDLSHEYFSWIYFYNKARKKNEFSEKIPIDIIKNESKYFYLG